MARWITTTMLLEELQTAEDKRGWDQFCSHFQPVVSNFAKRLGMSINDAEDAAQETMLAFLKAFRGGKYDRNKGSLSNWLFGIAKRVILNLRGRQPLEKLVADRTTGTSFWDIIEDDQSIQQTWEAEWRQMVLKRCLERVKGEFEPRVLDAFHLYAISGKPIEEVCAELEMSRNAVYINKSRVLSRLRKLAEDYQGSDGERII